MGVLTAITERNPSDKTIGGKSYPAATTRYTISYSFGDTQIETVALLKDFTPLASYKKITGQKLRTDGLLRRKILSLYFSEFRAKQRKN